MRSKLTNSTRVTKSGAVIYRSFTHNDCQEELCIGHIVGETFIPQVPKQWQVMTPLRAKKLANIHRVASRAVEAAKEQA